MHLMFIIYTLQLLNGVQAAPAEWSSGEASQKTTPSSAASVGSYRVGPTVPGSRGLIIPFRTQDLCSWSPRHSPLSHREASWAVIMASRGTPASRCPSFSGEAPHPAQVLSWLPAFFPFSVPIPLSISGLHYIHPRPFHLSNQHRTCLSLPLSTSLPVCRLQRLGAHRSPLQQL